MSSEKGLVFVVSAPAGTGKTTLVNMLQQELPGVTQSISYTTRRIRPGEKPDVDYHFISKKEFLKMIQENEFLEYAKVFDHFYGTSRLEVEKDQEEGKHVFLVIDTQGAMKIKNFISAIFIFISPPSFASLKKRLVGRNSDSKEEIEKRLSWAKKEMDIASFYKYQIVNDDLEDAYEELKTIVLKEIAKNR